MHFYKARSFYLKLNKSVYLLPIRDQREDFNEFLRLRVYES